MKRVIYKAEGEWKQFCDKLRHVKDSDIEVVKIFDKKIIKDYKEIGRIYHVVNATAEVYFPGVSPDGCIEIIGRNDMEVGKAKRRLEKIACLKLSRFITDLS